MNIITTINKDSLRQYINEHYDDIDEIFDIEQFSEFKDTLTYHIIMSNTDKSNIDFHKIHQIIRHNDNIPNMNDMIDYLLIFEETTWRIEEENMFATQLLKIT